MRVNPSDIPPVYNALSGAVGGAVANLAVFPLDLVVTRLQVQENKRSLKGKEKVKDFDQLYDGVVDAFKKIYKLDGIPEFYSGAAEDTVATTLTAFFYFYAYDLLRTRRVRYIAKRRGGKAPGTLGVAEELLIGTIAGMFCKLIVSPLSNITIRRQTQGAHGEHLSRLQVCKDIYREKGVLGFWAGYSRVILLSINPSLTYYFFQLIKALTLPRHKRDNPTSTQLFFISAFAKTVATMITYPLILSKTRLQASHSKDGARTISRYQELGISGLYQGAKGQVLKGFFSQGITMMTKDQIARLLIYAYFIARRAK
uniref:ARAD1B21252p n=1 Tax=Blastobotrys adeninivorans TaxID=409370 RepID=A0A060T775_BLAAD